jgi:hypothetical protein
VRSPKICSCGCSIFLPGTPGTTTATGRRSVGSVREKNLVGLTSLRTSYPPMLPKLNKKRAQFVLTKTDEILACQRRDGNLTTLSAHSCHANEHD